MVLIVRSPAVRPQSLGCRSDRYRRSAHTIRRNSARGRGVRRDGRRHLPRGRTLSDERWGWPRFLNHSRLCDVSCVSSPTSSFRRAPPISSLPSPHGLASFLQFYETRKDFQCSLEHVCSTGGLVGKSLSQRIRARLTANFVCSYGATEVSTVATAPAHVIEDSPGAVGFVVPGVAVEIVDRDGGRSRPAKKGRSASAARTRRMATSVMLRPTRRLFGTAGSIPVTSDVSRRTKCS
jgi:hypothetical protein